MSLSEKLEEASRLFQQIEFREVGNESLPPDLTDDNENADPKVTRVYHSLSEVEKAYFAKHGHLFSLRAIPSAKQAGNLQRFQYYIPACCGIEDGIEKLLNEFTRDSVAK